MDNFNYIKDWIKQCEGFSEKPYYDTVGKLTIGYGRNIEDVGISRDEAEIMFTNDINERIEALNKLDWYAMQPNNVKGALLNMSFMGIPRLLTFKKMIAALREKKYILAAIECLNSKWATQVGKRAKEVVNMIKYGDISARRTD